jgi:SAM-dependent methyltransferase
MQAYTPAFARVYNLRWAAFAKQAAPYLQEFYESTGKGQLKRPVLDLCCGTGQVARYFLDNGYPVTGIDLSAGMLEIAKENSSAYLSSGQVSWLLADAAIFALAERFGLVISTFDALNHLASMSALEKCFQCVFQGLEVDGWFIFDLNTRAGFQRWNSISIEDTEDLMVVNRGVFDETNNLVITRISGFVKTYDRLYERFEEVVYETIFDMQAVRLALLATGWRSVHFARLASLNEPIADPEAETRIFILARK